MNKTRSKTIDAIESKMEGLDVNSIRYQILKSAKNFKTSWIELGQSLYTVWKDKLYKEWGFLTFEAYVAKEIGIRKLTALKLLKSYYFLEKEEPQYLDKEYIESKNIQQVPSYESVNLLRLAKNKKEIDDDGYNKLKEGVFERGREPGDIKKDLTSMIRAREESDPKEVRDKKRQSILRRLIGNLKMARKEAELSKMLPSTLLKDISTLVSKIEAELKEDSDQ